MGYFEDKKPSCVVDVLGTPYSIYRNVPIDADPCLEFADGYADKTVKRIVIAGKGPECNLANWTEYEKVCVRHELVHAFLTESGVDGNVTWDVDGEEHPEAMVAWISMQFPKLLKAFQAVGAI